MFHPPTALALMARAAHVLSLLSALELIVRCQVLDKVYRAVSTGVRKELGELFRWCHKSEGLAGPGIQAPSV
jgi:hypothetical protein